MRTRAGQPASRRPATIPRDENLEAKTRRRRKAQGGTEATTRSILEFSAAAIQYTGGFHRCHGDELNGSPSELQSGKNQRKQKTHLTFGSAGKSATALRKFQSYEAI